MAGPEGPAAVAHALRNYRFSTGAREMPPALHPKAGGGQLFRASRQGTGVDGLPTINGKKKSFGFTRAYWFALGPWLLCQSH